MLLINKMDTEGAKEKYLEIKDQLKNLDGEYFNIFIIDIIFFRLILK